MWLVQETSFTRGQQADSTSGSWLAITHHPEPAKLARPGGEIIFFARRCLLLTVSRIFWLQIEVQPMAQSGSFRQQSACAAQTRSEPQPLDGGDVSSLMVNVQ